LGAKELEDALITLGKGLLISFQPSSLLYIFIGSAWGLFAGALPGFSTTGAVALLLPFTFWLRPEQAIMLFVGTMVGTQYGNNIPAVLIRTTGAPSAIMTVIEGYEFQRRGEGAKALGITVVSSTIGQVIGNLSLIFFVIPLAAIGSKFIAPEVFAFALFGLTAVSSLTGKNPVKGLLSAIFGLVIATVGTDPMSGQFRFTLGFSELEVGFNLVAVIIGFLAVAEVFRASRQVFHWTSTGQATSQIMPTWGEVKRIMRPSIIGALIGIVVGVMPGAGSNVASFAAYQQAKLWSKEQEKFGKGSLDALTSSDSANNACLGGDLVPTLALGIPGSVSAAVVMAGLIIYGVRPGPLLMERNPNIVQAFFGGIMVATLVAAVLYYLAIRPSVYISRFSRSAVMVTVLVLCTIGVYALDRRLFDVYVAWGFGVIGYFMNRYGYSPAAASLGLVLGYMVEENLRRGLEIAYGNPALFFGRPFTVLFLLFALLTFVYPYAMAWWGKRRGGEGVVNRAEVTTQQ